MNIYRFSKALAISVNVGLLSGMQNMFLNFKEVEEERDCVDSVKYVATFKFLHS